MEKIVSYHEFLKQKDNLENYLKELFDKIPELNVYFPINLSSDERHLIYSKSKGYLFEKLHKIGSKYSIKLWKPVDDGMNSVREEKNDYEEEEIVEEEENNDYEEENNDYEEEIEYYSFKNHLLDISSVLERQHDVMFSELQKCRRSVNRVECIFTFILVFNFIGSVLFLTNSVDFAVPLNRLNTVTDF